MAYQYTITIKRDSQTKTAGGGTQSDVRERVVSITAATDAAMLDTLKAELTQGQEICAAAGCGKLAEFFIAKNGDVHDPTARFACGRHKLTLTRKDDLAVPTASIK